MTAKHRRRIQLMVLECASRSKEESLKALWNVLCCHLSPGGGNIFIASLMTSKSNVNLVQWLPNVLWGIITVKSHWKLYASLFNLQFYFISKSIIQFSMYYDLHLREKIDILLSFHSLLFRDSFDCVIMFSNHIF